MKSRTGFIFSSRTWLGRVLGTSIFMGAAVLSVATSRPTCDSDARCADRSDDEDAQVCRILALPEDERPSIPEYEDCGPPFCDSDSDCEDGEVCDLNYDGYGGACVSPDVDAGSPDVDAGSPDEDAGS